MVRARTPTRHEPNDRGQAVPALVGVVAVLASFVVALAHFSAALNDAARARTAADAAALAGVQGGPEGAASLAAANGGRVVAFQTEGDDVIVTVMVGRARATARATDGP